MVTIDPLLASNWVISTRTNLRRIGWQNPSLRSAGAGDSRNTVRWRFVRSVDKNGLPFQRDFSTQTPPRWLVRSLLSASISLWCRLSLPDSKLETLKLRVASWRDFRPEIIEKDELKLPTISNWIKLSVCSSSCRQMALVKTFHKLEIRAILAVSVSLS